MLTVFYIIMILILSAAIYSFSTQDLDEGEIKDYIKIEPLIFLLILFIILLTLRWL